MLGWLDWKFRWGSQEILNFCGKNFGLTRKRVVRDGTVIHILLTLAICGMRMGEETHLVWSVLWGLGALIYCFFMALIARALIFLTEIDGGYDFAWQKLGFFRKLNLVFLVLKFLTIALPHHSWYLMTWAQDISILAVLYAASCIDPPKKKKSSPRESKTPLTEALSGR